MVLSNKSTVLLLGALLSCGAGEQVETQARLDVAEEPGIVVDDADTGFALIADDDYHQFGRSDGEWESVAVANGHGGSAKLAHCGQNAGVGSVVVWSFDVADGEHEVSVFVPEQPGPRDEVMYCVLWKSPKLDSHCQWVDQKVTGWHSLGVHRFDGKATVALDPLVCMHEAAMPVWADAARMTTTPVNVEVAKAP